MFSISVQIDINGIVSDSNKIFLWHKSENINKKGYFQNFSCFQFYVYKLCMIMYIGINVLQRLPC